MIADYYSTMERLTTAQLRRGFVLLAMKKKPSPPKTRPPAKPQVNSDATPEVDQDGRFVSVVLEEGGLAAFANHLVVQGVSDEVHLSFFQIQPPMIFGSDEQKTEQLKKVDHIDGKHVARIIVARKRLAGIVKVLQEQLDRDDV